MKALETVQESMSLNNVLGPAIIISASGMASGGRVLHHLKRKISDPRNTVLFIGFQAEGTKGRLLVDGAETIRIHKKEYAVKARIEYIDALSCHADYEEILEWMKSIVKAPQQIYLVHGEESAALSLAEKIEGKYKYPVSVPSFGEETELN